MRWRRLCRYHGQGCQAGCQLIDVLSLLPRDWQRQWDGEWIVGMASTALHSLQAASRGGAGWCRW